MTARAYDWSQIPNLVIRGDGCWCHARIEINGRQYWRALRIQADPEGANADLVKDSLRAFKAQMAKDHFAILQLTRSRNEHSPLSAIFAAYRAASAGRDIREETYERNISCLSYIVRTVHGEFFDVQNGRASLLTSDLLATFQEKRIAALKDEARTAGWTAEEFEQRMKSAKNTIKSNISQARSAFAAKLLQSRHYRDLVLPDLAPFLKFSAEGSTVAAFVRPSAAVWQRIVAELPHLRETRLALWFAFQLGVNCGLRRGSARSARWAWCKEIENGEAEMEVRRAKGGHYFVRIPADVWREILAARGSTDHIIPSTLPAGAYTPAQLEENRDATISELVGWLRERGLDAQKPFHTLRKIFGNAVVVAHGLTEGQNALGHSKQDLTDSTYTDHRSTRGVRVV